MIEVKTVGDVDLQQIHDMAQVVFRHTYRDILSPDQMEYMMDMMYSLPNLHQQLREGHHYYMACDDGQPCGYVSVQYHEMDGDTKVFHLHNFPCPYELNVNRYNKAVDFYRHLGMRVLLEEDFPIGNGFYKTDYIMGLNL